MPQPAAPSKGSSSGQLYYIIGPSGAGKDSLISALREQFVDDLVVAHRYITRAADAGGENHIALSEDEFFVRYSRNMFAMSWQAHGLCYGIGQEVNHWMDSGLNVVVNGSRAYLNAAKERFGSRLTPVLVHVSSEVLEDRLRARGREDEQKIALRLKRAKEYTADSELCPFRIDNSGSLAESVAQFRHLLQQGQKRQALAGDAV